MTQPTLVSLHVSPWSERARWALDHHRVAYKKIPHQPVLGELRLRKLLGRHGKHAGPATVPALIDGDTLLRDSWDIARWADEHGQGAPLIPAEHAAEIRRWNDLADQTMAHARVLIVANMLATPASMDESMPPAIPRWIARLSRPINRAGTKWFARKYGVDPAATGPAITKMRETLTTLRQVLAGRPYLLGASSSRPSGPEFTYADIVMSTMLQGVLPVSDEYIRLGPATRTVWTQPALAAEFPELLAWRDDLYRRHRRPVRGS